MPAPARVRFSYLGYRASAFYLGDTGEIPPEAPVCKHCAPLKTKMLHQYDFTRHTKGVEHNIAIYKCTICKRQWAIGWQNKNDKSEGI